MLGSTVPASAFPVQISVTSDGDPTGVVSDGVVVTDNNANSVVPPLRLTEDNEANGVTYVTNIPGMLWNLPNTLFLSEPGASDSDILTLINLNHKDAYIYFTSDDENGAVGNIPILNPQFGFAEGPNGVSVIGNFSLVPEPMTLSVLGAGLAGLAGLRRRRKAA